MVFAGLGMVSGGLGMHWDGFGGFLKVSKELRRPKWSSGGSRSKNFEARGWFGGAETRTLRPSEVICWILEAPGETFHQHVSDF